jgi:alanine racemase
MIELRDLLQATGGQLHTAGQATQFSDLAYDSRRIEELLPQIYDDKGPLFVAIKSETGDGHDHASEAVYRGAKGVLCERVPPDVPSTTTCILVPDTRRALLDWAYFILHKRQITVIGVTGSSGKTTTKEAIAAVLGTRYRVFRNQGSYSGRFGLPIALGRLRPSHQIAVLELAADSVDEIRDLAAIVSPQIGVVTNVNRAHIDHLGSIEAIAREKGRLVEALPQDGIAILNRDDPLVWEMRHRTRARVLSFGFSSEADYRVHDIQYHADRTILWVETPLPAGSEKDVVQDCHRIMTTLLGRHQVYAILAAYAAGHVCQTLDVEIQKALEAMPSLPGRLHILDGIRGSVLLDDTYDAELACTCGALKAVKDHFPSHRRIAVLGGLQSEAGADPDNTEIGRCAAENVDMLVLKGERTQSIRKAALSAGTLRSNVFETFTNHEAIQYLTGIIAPGDVVLIKGPKEERMEAITRGLMLNPAQASSILVRQQDAFRQVQFALPQRPTWIEIDLEAIAHNLRQVQQMLHSSTGVMVILKADGYGHGAIRIARTAVNNGADMLGVACLSEGVALRRAGIKAAILILGYTPAWQARETVLNDITATVFDIETTRAFDRAAAQVGQMATVHVKVDTGMGRLGLLPDAVLPFLQEAIDLDNVVVQGLFTHFSVADEAIKEYTYKQLGSFRQTLSQIQAAGIDIPIVHASNSAALLSIPEARFDMVRLGIALYGL